MAKKKIYHINDRTMKYQSLILARHQHNYLQLPGTFEAQYPQEIVFPNMDAGRVDEFYTTAEGLLINLEEESGAITEKVLEKIGKYLIFGAFMYSKKPYSAIICHEDPKKEFEYFELSPSVFIKVHYIHMPQDELWMKYGNLIKKIEQKQQLTIEETLDIVFVAKFISKEYGQYITESLAKAFKHAKLNDEIPKRDIGVLLGGMILKYFQNDEKIDELMEEIKKENEKIKREREKIKSTLKLVRKQHDLPPEAEKIIDSLLS